jgi:hypothetical protein
VTANPAHLPEIPAPPKGSQADEVLIAALLELELHCVFDLQPHIPQGMGGWVVTSAEATANADALAQYDVIFECNDARFSGSQADIAVAIERGRPGAVELSVYSLKTQLYRTVRSAQASSAFGVTVRPCKLQNVGSETVHRI